MQGRFIGKHGIHRLLKSFKRGCLCSQMCFVLQACCTCLSQASPQHRNRSVRNVGLPSKSLEPQKARGNGQSPADHQDTCRNATDRFADGGAGLEAVNLKQPLKILGLG